MQSKEKENERNLTRERGNFGFVSLSLDSSSHHDPIPASHDPMRREQKPGN